ncbi:MAG: DUF4386 family protein [Alphaproteobacteria bacterium]|nr:MAG: DUF4386 family protein [Alphaproteobacteria bacterium]
MMSPAHSRTTGLLILAFLVAVAVPYVALIELFGYDDVLRDPPGAVLDQFAAAGTPLVLAWLGFALAALAFAPLSRRIDRDSGLAAGWMGVASAVAQGVGLARWVFAVPALAAAHASSDPALRAGAEATFVALHGFLGAGLGEVAGQSLLAAWTARVCLGLWRQGRRILSISGAATLPLWCLGLTEPLATVIPGLPVIEAAPLAFTGWEVWLLALALGLLIDARRRTARSR